MDISSERARLRSKLKCGIYKLRENISATKSKVWKTFRRIVDDDGKELEWVACRYCFAVFKHRGRSHGTSTLTRHKCRVLNHPNSFSDNNSHFSYGECSLF